VLLLDNNRVLVHERGYREGELILDKAELAKHLRSLIKYEFPRSRKVRLYQLENPEELAKDRKKL
jgi:hypothetical protein